LKEGLLLNYNTPTSLVWTGYSLDGSSNITTQGNTTIPMPAEGNHMIQVYGNDSSGTYYRSELRSFQYDILEAPSTPLNLQATANENSVTLNWAPPTNDGGAIVTNYNIYRGRVSGSYSFLAAVSGTTFQDNAVDHGVTYFYVVTAVNSIGESLFSNEAFATPVTVPTPPQSLDASTDGDFIELSWSLPSSDGGAEITYYNVYRGTSSGSYSFLEYTSDMFFKDSDVKRGIVYYYVVTAVNSIGESGYSNEASATLPVLPETTTETTEPGEPSSPRITSSPSFLTILFFFGILVVFIHRLRKKK
ncbi:MAG: fibronectin type III domain-containing protein, partial [Promethearchaeota archaeon]